MRLLLTALALLLGGADAEDASAQASMCHEPAMAISQVPVEIETAQTQETLKVVRSPALEESSIPWCTSPDSENCGRRDDGQQAPHLSLRAPLFSMPSSEMGPAPGKDGPGFEQPRGDGPRPGHSRVLERPPR